MTTRPVARRLAAGAAALTLVMTGCGSADRDGDGEVAGEAATTLPSPPSSDPSSDAGPSSGSGSGSGSGSAAPEDPAPTEADPRARKALKAAILGLLRAGSGRYEVVVPLGAGYTIREKGRYRIDPPVFEAVRRIGGPDGEARLAYRSVDDRLWFRLEGARSDENESAGWPCWVDHAAMARASDAAAVDLGQAAAGQPPAAVIAASWGTGFSRDDEERIDGTIDLASTLGLVSTKFLLAAGVDPQADDVVPASFTVRDGMLTGYEVSLADVPAAVEAGGGDLPDELQELHVLPGAITARFLDTGGPVQVAGPPVGQRLRLGPAADFESAMRSCGG